MLVGAVPTLILKRILTHSIDKPDMTEIGDLKGLNSNARVMVKLALYSAWARLQISSSEQAYLVDIVSPYTAMLTPLWLSSLQEFARLRFEPEISGTMGPMSLSDNPDDIYSALNREILLKVYIPMTHSTMQRSNVVLGLVLSRFLAKFR